MGKTVVSVVALGSIALVLFGLFQWTNEQDSGGNSSVVRAAGPELATPAPQPEVELIQPDEASSASRSLANNAAEQPIGKVSEPDTHVAEPDRKPQGGETVLEVLVVDGANRPVEGAAITLENADEELEVRFLSGGLRSVGPKTNQNGLANVALKANGLVRLIAKADGFASSSSEVLEVETAALQGRVEITLSEGGSVAGRLLDIHGAPAVDVPISIHLTQWPGSLRRSRPTQMKRAVTAGDGTILFENLTPGSYTLYTRAVGEALTLVPNERVELEVLEGERTTVQFAEISGTYVRVHGTVIRNSEPLANARISIHWADRSRGYLGKNVKADGDGHFAIILDEGAMYRFQISTGRGGGSVFREIEIPSVPSHEVQISFDTGSLSGHLLGPDGEPVEGLKITAFGKSVVEGSGTTIQSTNSQAGGAFEFSNLVSGTYKLAAKTIPIGGGIADPVPTPKHPYLGACCT